MGCRLISCHGSPLQLPQGSSAVGSPLLRGSRARLTKNKGRLASKSAVIQSWALRKAGIFLPLPPTAQQLCFHRYCGSISVPNCHHREPSFGRRQPARSLQMEMRYANALRGGEWAPVASRAGAGGRRMLGGRCTPSRCQCCLLRHGLLSPASSPAPGAECKILAASWGRGSGGLTVSWSLPAEASELPSPGARGHAVPANAGIQEPRFSFFNGEPRLPTTHRSGSATVSPAKP